MQQRHGEAPRPGRWLQPHQPSAIAQSTSTYLLSPLPEGSSRCSTRCWLPVLWLSVRSQISLACPHNPTKPGRVFLPAAAHPIFHNSFPVHLALPDFSAHHPGIAGLCLQLRCNMDDSSFGPRLLDRFDFTLVFEHSMFYIAPASIIIFSTPYYAYTIFRGTPIVRSGILLWLKLACVAALIGIHISDAVLWSSSPLASEVSKAATLLSCIAAVCVAILVYASHVYFLQPRVFLGFFLSVTMLFDIATTLTYFNRPDLHTIARLHIPIPVLKFGIICLEEVSKRRLIRSEALRATLGDDALAGFWNNSLLIWVNSVLLFGFRSDITVASLPSLGLEFQSESLYGDFSAQWDKVSRDSRWALLKACVRTIPWPFLYVVLPRLFRIGFDFAQPFLLQDIVNTVSLPAEPSTDVMRGLILATATVYIGKTVCLPIS